MSDPIPNRTRWRDAVAEQREREAYVLLAHTLNVADARLDRDVAETRLARDLVFDEARVHALVEFLERVGYLARIGTGSVRLTPRGVEYAERAAGARSSVRPTAPTRRALGRR